MILAVDVDYRAHGACVAGVSFEDWSDQEAKKVYRSNVAQVVEYKPGSFYLRELPCILKLLDEHKLHPNYIVIDGYVYLGKSFKSGLGSHLYNRLGKKVAIIGVAKKRFVDTPIETEVYRGRSLNPLYVTAAGIDLDRAKKNIMAMSGVHRMPILLKQVDRECKKLIS